MHGFPEQAALAHAGRAGQDEPWRIRVGDRRPDSPKLIRPSDKRPPYAHK
ncbi:hypothetical protein GCM10027569_02070 [Flindersiella endophytica]